MTKRAGLDQAARLLQPHAAFLLYLASLCYLLSSVYAVSGFKHFPLLALYAAALPATYMLLWRIAPVPRILSAGVLAPRATAIAWTLVSVATCLVFAHYIHLGTVPIAAAFFDTDYFSVMFIRQRIFEDASALWRYAPNILLKSIFPFLLFYFSGRSLAGFLTTLLIGSLYAVSLLNKIFVVLVVLPALIACLLQLRLARVALLAMVAVTSLAFLALIQNPQLRPEAWIEAAKQIARVTKLGSNPVKPIDLNHAKPSPASTPAVENSRIDVSIDRSAPMYNAFDTIRRRVIDVPGQVINTWFDTIPSRLPFARGCGYRWLAPILGCERQSFSAQIDQIENPHLAHIGVHGSMTAASFMEDYANFGRTGLVASAIVLALALGLIAAVFGHDWQANLALSATPVLMLMETPLTTVILTGGWIFTILLYILLSQPHSAPEFCSQSMRPDTAGTRVGAACAHTIYVPAVGRTRPMSVAIVTSIHPDFDARIWKHARLLTASGHEVHLICPWSVERGSMQDGVVFHPFPKTASRALRIVQAPLRVIPRVLSILGRVDVVHFHDIDLLPWMALLSVAKPVVYDVHENYADEMLVREWIPKWARRPLAGTVRWGQWSLSHVVRNIVLVAPSQEPDFSSRRLTRTFIYNFASRDLLAAARDDYAARPNAVIFVGSQHENNGSLLLLEIASLVAAARPDVTFLAVDRFMDASFRGRFLAEVSRRRLERTVRLFPNVKPHELMSIMNQATIGISPNLRVAQQIKGIHTKVFEYMAAGLPMVLSDLPHQLEVLRASSAGLPAAPERPAEFADAILRLVTDRSAAYRMGQRGQAAFLAKYSYESQLGEMLRFYRRVLGAPA